MILEHICGKWGGGRQRYRARKIPLVGKVIQPPVSWFPIQLKTEERRGWGGGCITHKPLLRFDIVVAV